MSTPETSLTQYRFVDPTSNPKDRVPLEDLYSAQYQVEEARAYQRLTNPMEQALGMPPTPEPTPTEPKSVEVDISPEGLAATSDAAKRIPALEARRKISTEFKDPTLRDAVNKVLGTVTGGVITLDTIDEHLKAELEGKPSPLSAKLRSSEALKLLDPVGNTMEALTREQLKREGTLTPQLQDKVASSVGVLAGLLTPMGTGKKGAKFGTEVLMNSMVSAPTTHAANIASNALTATWSIGERFLSASYEALAYGVSLGKHDRQIYFGESGAMLVGALSSTIDAIIAAGEVLRTGKSSLPSIMEDMAARATQSEKPLMRYGPEGLRAVERDAKDTTMLGQGQNFWGTVWRMPTRALGAEDVAFKTINRQMEIYAQAYREAARTGDRSFSNLKRLIENPDPLVKMKADNFAITNTFQRSLNELGPNMERFGNIAGDVADISMGAIPLGRLVVPFVRTQANTIHFALERAPILNMLSSTLRADLAAGGELRALAMGKIAGGATLASAVMYMSHAGLISGGGPTDKTLLKNKIELEGWRPYSVRIGDTWYSYDRLSPIGSLLGIVADMSEIGGSIDPSKLSHLSQAVTFASTHNLTSKSFITSSADLLQAVTGDTKALDRLAKGTISAITPGMLRTIKKGFDPLQRETQPGADPEQHVWAELRTYLNEVKAQTPGWSTTLEPRLNLWGDPIEIPSGFGPDWLSPVYQSVKKNDPAGDEIVRLGKLGLASVGRAPRVILGRDPEGHPIDQPASPLDMGIELTDKEYSEFVKLAGNELKVKGLGLHEELNRLVTSDEKYKNYSDAAKGLAITNLVTGYRQAAVGQLLKNNPALVDAYKERAKAKGDALRGTVPQTQTQSYSENILRYQMPRIPTGPTF